MRSEDDTDPTLYLWRTRPDDLGHTGSATDAEFDFEDVMYASGGTWNPETLELEEIRNGKIVLMTQKRYVPNWQGPRNPGFNEIKSWSIFMHTTGNDPYTWWITDDGSFDD